MSGWNSVVDHPPVFNEDGETGELLVYSDEGILVASCTLYKASGYRKEDDMSWSEKGTGCGCCCERIIVTHWMPLPNKPEDV